MLVNCPENSKAEYSKSEMKTPTPCSLVNDDVLSRAANTPAANYLPKQVNM